MHLKGIKITSSFILHGRGRVLITDLDYDTEYHRFRAGDTLRVDENVYEVLNVEAILKKEDGINKDFVAFIVKEITINELLKKKDKKNKSNWIKKNKWWLKVWVIIKSKFNSLFHDNGCK